MTTGYLHVLGYWVKYETTHADPCPWCAAARDVAQGHMRDASYKTTKYTRTDAHGEKHTASMERMGRGMRPIITKGSGVSGPVTITVPGVLTYQDPQESQYGLRVNPPFSPTMDMGIPPGTYTLKPEASEKPAVDPCDLSDDTLRRISSDTESNWDRAMIEEVMNLRIKLSRQRDVVLDMTEAESALVLDLLAGEVDRTTAEADNHYTDGDGYEAECAQARAHAREAEQVADRLRKALGKHLDKTYNVEVDK